jgi:hypothetical protein
MQTLRLVDNVDDNDILNWLNSHSVSLSQGLPVRLLLARWQQAGREHARLTASLERLMDAGWIAPTPGAEPPHLRFAATGYTRLLEESTNTAIALEPFTMPAPAAASPAAAPAKVVTEPEAPAPLFLAHGTPMTELGLRNQVLGVFRDLGLRAGTQLIAVTLTRYWQETGLRAGDLRRALDVVTRDGYLTPHRDGMDLYWQLTPEGEAWVRAPITPAPLLAAAPEVREVRPATDDDELRVAAAYACARRSPADGSAFDYASVKADWQKTGLDENALLHALDWLAKERRLETFVDEQQRTRLRLTPEGTRFAAAQPTRGAERLIKLMG